MAKKQKKKKSKIKVFFTRLFFLLIIAVAIAAGVFFLLVGGGDSADVVFSEGSVVIKTVGSDEWVPLSGDMTVKEGDEIMTERGATAELFLPDGSVLKVGSASHVIIRGMGTVEITRRTTNVFELAYGKVRAVVSPFVNKKSEFVIETENAAIGVRGTDFGVSYDEQKKKTELACLDGEVEVRSKEKKAAGLPPVLVKANEGLSFVVGTLPGQPVRWTEAQTRAFFTRMDFEGKKIKDHLMRGGRMLEKGGKEVKENVEEGVKEGTDKLKSGGEKAVDKIKKIF
ncbi:MAG: FecR domain-containing protein [Deltaproteobacteria bacterium]|uniref:FecR domain-containing protein n=1 Tax=Candidatus Zymogenus saltonus TaxID=2844893 RepID=A0A9D8KE37_9DELT|nr:FecR domain-containing protein [Candidatus Zymogenus saltonus]